jgi:hypothetical protein
VTVFTLGVARILNTFKFKLTPASWQVQFLVCSGGIPVDQEWSSMHSSVWVRRSSSVPEVFAKLFGLLIRVFFDKQVDQDKVIWDRKLYKEQPVLIREDGPIGHYRLWCKRFYGPIERSSVP